MVMNALAEEVAKGVATGYLVPLEYLYSLHRPNRMQRSVVNILKLFDVYAQFIPAWVFRGDRNTGDFEDSSINQMSISVGTANEPPCMRRELLKKAAQLPLHQKQLAQRRISSSTYSDHSVPGAATHERSSQRSSGVSHAAAFDAPQVPLHAPRDQHPMLQQQGHRSDGISVLMLEEEQADAAMRYRPRMVDNALYPADVTVICIKLPSVEPTDNADRANHTVRQLDRILKACLNTIDDGLGMVQSLWGDQLIAVFNGALTNPHHVRDAATCICILAESLNAMGATCSFGLARGCAQVGIVSGLYGQRCVLVGDVLERARELTVANRVMNSQILCDWTAGHYLQSSFALRLVGFWVRSPQERYMFAEVLGMSQNDDAAVRVQEACHETGTMMSVRVCYKDFTAHNDLLHAIARGDERQRDLLIQQCRMTQAVSERNIKSLIETGLPQYTQESAAEVRAKTLQ